MGRAKASSVFGETSTGPGVKSLSCGITGNVQWSMLNVQRLNTEDSRETRESTGETPALPVLLDKADVAAALDTGLLYFRDIVVAQTEAHVLFNIVCGDMVASHRSKNEITIFNDYFRQAFNEATEPMGVKGNEGQKPMQK